MDTLEENSHLILINGFDYLDDFMDLDNAAYFSFIDGIDGILNDEEPNNCVYNADNVVFCLICFYCCYHNCHGFRICMVAYMTS